MPIELVCFDLGGVLIRLCDGWEDARLRAGIRDCQPKTNFHQHPLFAQVNHQFERGEIDQTEYTDQLAQLINLAPHQILAMLNAWLVEPYPGIDAMLDQLEATTVRTACLSNTNHTHWRAMTCPGPAFLPLHRLHNRFASPFIGHRKPETKIYQHVQNETGIPPQAILFFDDLPENVYTAQRQGWHAYEIDPTEDPMVQATKHLQRHGVL